MSLRDKLLKAGSLDDAAFLDKSKFFKDKELIPLPVPIMNLAYSGRLEPECGGIGPGLHMLAGPSKHFKSNMGLVVVKAFQDKEPEGIVLFYDSEFGASQGYFSNFGIDESRVIHLPIMNIEELKFDIMQKLEAIDAKSDKVMIFIDSIGNLASKKEVEDAINEKAVADMTRAKQLKSLWRIVTPYLTKKKIVCLAINHTYDTQEMYSKKVVSGGTGGIYSSDTIFIIGRRQSKEGTDLVGYDFILNADKSRFIREGSQLPVSVRFDGGINKWSGLLDIALLVGFVEKPKNGWFTRVTVDGDKNWRRADTDCEEFWAPLLGDKAFCDRVAAMFKLTSTEKLADFDQVDVDVEDEFEVDPDTGEILNI